MKRYGQAHTDALRRQHFTASRGSGLKLGKATGHGVTGVFRSAMPDLLTEITRAAKANHAQAPALGPTFTIE